MLTTPRDRRSTLESQGIDKNLAKQARALSALSAERFEQAIAGAQRAARGVLTTVVNGIDLPRQSPTPPPPLLPELAALVDACIVLAGADVVKAHIRGLQQIDVSLERFRDAARWVERQLRRRR